MTKFNVGEIYSTKHDNTGLLTTLCVLHVTRDDVTIGATDYIMNRYKSECVSEVKTFHLIHDVGSNTDMFNYFEGEGDASIVWFVRAGNLEF